MNSVPDIAEMMLIFSNFSGEEKKAVARSTVSALESVSGNHSKYLSIENMWEGDMPKRPEKSKNSFKD